MHTGIFNVKFSREREKKQCSDKYFNNQNRKALILDMHSNDYKRKKALTSFISPIVSQEESFLGEPFTLA
jgi:hypothetical protein